MPVSGKCCPFEEATSGGWCFFFLVLRQVVWRCSDPNCQLLPHAGSWPDCMAECSRTACKLKQRMKE